MHSELTSAHLPALVIDGSSSRFFAGVLNKTLTWSAQITSEKAPLESLFGTVEQVLAQSDLELDQIKSFIYSEGPGSVLGLRLCAMAIETWKRLGREKGDLFAYNSLQLTAASILNEPRPDAPTLVISDWKKDAWNSTRIENSKLGTVEPVDTAIVENWEGPLYHLPARKGWQKAPANATSVHYQPQKLPELLPHHPLLRKTSGIELYSSGANTFQKWTPERHRAST